ncbi:MAG: LamG-like jellyroll fold domain-containing protein [Candidatus Brocadiia bacterium]
MLEKRARVSKPGSTCITALFLVLPALFCSLPVSAQQPEAAFDKNGPSHLRWRGGGILGEKHFAVERLILQKHNPEKKELWGYSFVTASVDSPKVQVFPAKKQIRHTYPWGLGELEWNPGPDRLDLVLTLKNTSDRTIADFRVRLLEFAFERTPGWLRRGVVHLTLDHPYAFKVPLETGKLFATCESFHNPVQFGFGRARGKRNPQVPLIVLGGVAALEEDSFVLPILGRPQIPPGEELQLKFVLRFAPSARPDATVLRPFYKAFHAAQKPHINWSDRRPIGKIILAGSPRHVTPENPRGWFRAPKMKTGTPEGREKLRKKLMGLADEAVKHLQAADAQGVVIWNIEGGHIYPEYPFGDPRRLPDIAPEMDKLADDFFRRFRQAGLRTGVCIRPSVLHYGERRQRWTQGPGSYDREHENFAPPLKNARSHEIAAGRVYPLARRLSDKIEYAKQRWGCSIFYIHDNGFWSKAGPGRLEDWMLFNARTFQRLRELQPDVLLIPRYAERHWRSARSAEILKSKAGYRIFTDSLRGTGEKRIGGLPTPRWVIGNMLRYRQIPRRIKWRRAIPDRIHVLHHSYWANSAPYVELKLKRLIREHVLTLKQHMEYDYEEAEKMAAEEIAFESTPPRVREWRADAFTVTDVEGANLEARKPQLRRAVAWGDVLMWSARENPHRVREIYDAARSKQKRIAAAARQIGLLDEDDIDPLPPLSRAWRLGESVDPVRIVAERSVPANLRTRVVFSPDKKRALLMVVWQKGSGHMIRLKPDLPGIDLPQKHTWHLGTGLMPAKRSPIKVEPDPIAGLSALYLQSTPKTRKHPPEGVLVGISFDKSMSPDFGGGPPGTDRGSRKGNRTKARNGNALQVSGARAAYGVVPSWLNGSLEFDIKPQKSGDRPLRILALKHHLDLELSLQQQHGQTVLGLRFREIPAQTGDGDSAGEDAETRKIHAALRPGTWYHVVLTWDIGQYRLYVDGNLTDSASGPVKLRRRDGTALEPGLIVGGGETSKNGRALVDSLIAYTWPFTKQQAGSRMSSNGMKPVEKPEKQPITVWLWGSFPKNVNVGINSRPAPNWSRAERFQVTLYERLQHGRQRVAFGTLQSYNGVGLGKLRFKRSKKIESGEDLGASDDMSLDAGDTGDDLGMLEGEVDTGTSYVMEVKPLPEGKGPPARTVRFSAASHGIDSHRW